MHSKHGLEISGCTFSPRSKLLVVSSGLASPRGFPPNRARLNKNLQNMHQLWHKDLGQVNAGAMLVHLAKFEAAIRLDAVAWHSSPHLCLLYATPCRDGSLHFLDGLRHTLLCSWTPKWLASVVSLPASSWVSVGAHASIRNAKQISLSWCPDGSTLLRLADGHATLMVLE